MLKGAGGVYEKIKAQKKLDVLDNEGHVFHNGADRLLKLIIEFLRSYL
jgi:hypothetical protein